MIVKFTTLGEKRHLISEEEISILNTNVTGRVICPAGLVVDVNEKTKPILLKLGLKIPQEKKKGDIDAR